MAKTKAQATLENRQWWTARRLNEAAGYLESAMGCIEEANAEIARGGLVDGDRAIETHLTPWAASLRELAAKLVEGIDA